jgi:hypothetical protein
MARTALTVTDTAGPAGVTTPALVAVDAVNGNSFANTAREWIRIDNASGGSLTVTFITTATYQGYAIADKPVTIANGASRTCGPFDTALFSSSVGVDYSTGTGVTAQVLKLSSTLF